MALDSRQKRAAVIGVARIWYRNADPNGMDEAQRAAVGAAYPVASFQGPPAVIPGEKYVGFVGASNIGRLGRIGGVVLHTNTRLTFQFLQ